MLVGGIFVHPLNIFGRLKRRRKNTLIRPLQNIEPKVSYLGYAFGLCLLQGFLHSTVSCDRDLAQKLKSSEFRYMF